MSQLFYYCSDCNRFHSQAEPQSEDPTGQSRWLPIRDRRYCRPASNFSPNETFDKYLLGIVEDSANSYVYYALNALIPSVTTTMWSTATTTSPWGIATLVGDSYFTLRMPIGSSLEPINTLKRNVPDFTSDAWCSANLPAGFSWGNKYLAIKSNSRYPNGEGEPGRPVSGVWHSCAHCAWKEARAAVQQRSRDYAWLLQGYEGMLLPTNLVGNVEITSEPALMTSATIKDVAERIANSCGNCGRVGHRSDGCTNKPKVFDRVGVEIEGRFNDLPSVIDRARNLTGVEGYRDSSVYGSNDSNAEPWEFQTKPDSIRGACQQVVDLYPDETDSSCGMHVHVSFSRVDASLLNSVSFFKYFKTRWEAWGARMGLDPRSNFFKRLRGGNEYCLPAGEVEYVIRQQDRYSQLNFTSYTEHGTVECRLLPMFVRASLAVSAIQELLDIYDTFLQDPEAFGHPGFSAEAAFTPAEVEPVKLPMQVLDFPPEITYTNALEMELCEIPPVPDGCVRVAMGINQPVTIQGLVAAIQARTAA